MVKQLYHFVNKNMINDEVCSKTNKIINHKEINIIAVSEEIARKETARPKLDKNGILSKEYILEQVFNLNKDWN